MFAGMVLTFNIISQLYKFTKHWICLGKLTPILFSLSFSPPQFVIKNRIISKLVLLNNQYFFFPLTNASQNVDN